MKNNRKNRKMTPWGVCGCGKWPGAIVKTIHVLISLLSTGELRWTYQSDNLRFEPEVNPIFQFFSSLRISSIFVW